MVVNEDAGDLNNLGALRFFASKLAPTRGYAVNFTPGLARSSTLNSNTSGRA